jgi:hypothetical protein
MDFHLNPPQLATGNHGTMIRYRRNVTQLPESMPF